MSEKKGLVFESITNMPIPIVTFNKPLSIDYDSENDKYLFDLETKKALLYLRILNRRMGEIQQLKDKVLDMFDDEWPLEIYVDYNHIPSRNVGEKIIKEETRIIEHVLGFYEKRKERKGRKESIPVTKP